MILQVDDKIILETVDLKHSKEIFDLTHKNRNYLREWLPWVDKTVTEGDTIAFINTALKQQENKNGFQSVIRFNNEIVGIIGLHFINYLNNSTAIGYWLDEKNQRKGIMTKTCTVLTDFCFKTIGLNRIEIECATENYPSQKIPERLNFALEGIKREAEFVNDRYLDHKLYAKLKREWN